MKRGIKYKSGFIGWDEIGKWVLGIAVLIIVIGGYLILKYKGIEIIDYIKNLFRFRV